MVAQVAGESRSLRSADSRLTEPSVSRCWLFVKCGSATPWVESTVSNSRLYMIMDHQFYERKIVNPI